VVGFCSNDYLGLADSPLSATTPVSPGAGASRLICGDLPVHRRLERTLADLVGAEDAVLFPSGFQLNVGVLPCLLERHDTVHSDALNHASLIDGLRLSPTTCTILSHRQPPPHSIPSPPALNWWVTESIFSMDGDRLDIPAVTDHIAVGGALYVDEAHAFGLFSGGQALLGHHGIRPTVLVGTLSKALGGSGAFAAASADVCHYLRTCARSFVFSTGLSPVVGHLLEAALERVAGSEGDQRRRALWDNIAQFAARMGLSTEAPSPIFPIIVGSNHTALDLASALLERGWHVQPIRPPTVPDGTARLRITITAAHDPVQIDGLAHDLLQLLAEAPAVARV
jgi:7-keto-8-aminopelargonate synthetase-like enzyme